MADIIDLHDCTCLCVAVTTGLVLLISFFVYKCIKRDSFNKSPPKNKPKKGKEKKKVSEHNDQSLQKSSSYSKAVESPIKSIVSISVPSMTAPKLDISARNTTSQSREHDIIAVEDDEWVTVKRGKYTQDSQPQTAEIAPHEQQKNQQKPKPKQKDSVKQNKLQSNIGKKAVQQKKQRSSDEESYSKPVYVPPPVIEKPVEDEWQEIPSTKKKKQRARKE